MIKGRIYKLTSPNTNMVYIGSTTETLNSRLRKHIYDMKRKNSSSRHVLEKGDFKIELIEEVYVESKDDLRKIEQNWIEKTPNAVNKIRAFDVNPKEQKKEYDREHNRNSKKFCKVCNVWIKGRGMLVRHEQTPKHIRNFILS